jgi:RNA recognition motif-containing protein
VNIYVGKLHPDASEVELTALFKAFGQVHSVSVMRELFTGASKGFAFVAMPGKAQSLAGIAGLNGKELLGKAMRVNESRPQSRGPQRRR